MNRLISEQEVLKVIDNLKANFTCYDSVTLDEVASHVKAIPSAEPKTGHWISVSERLPERYTYTLWCASSGYVRSDYFNGEFWEDAKKLGYEVIAWMPLPKPYEPQESEDKDANKKCTYKETGCGSCKRQLDCPIEADTSESEGVCDH